MYEQDYQLKATLYVYPTTYFSFFLFSCYFHKGAKRYNEHTYTNGDVESWNSLQYNYTPFSEQ